MFGYTKAPINPDQDAFLTNKDKQVRDGRTLRAERNRQTIAETFLDLIEQGELNPTAQMLSEYSGVSTSTIFRLYED
ncbi:MAG: hypothetical protein AAF512_25870, partial [Pseudomonadota bacterium]